MMADAIGHDACVRIVAFGDSTTAVREGMTVYADLLAKAWQGRTPSIEVINAGVRGNHTDHAVARLDVDVLAHQPAIVIIRFGINDSAIDVWQEPPAVDPRVPLAKFRQNLALIVEQVIAVGAVPVLCTPNLLSWSELTLSLYGKSPYRPEDADGFNVTLREYVAEIRQFAMQQGLPLVDVDAAFRQFPSDIVPPWHELLLDGMHPNDRGQELAAALLLPVLEKY